MADILALAGAAALIFVIRILGTAIGTLRLLLMNRGMEMWTAVAGFFEVLVYVVGVGWVVKDLSNIPILLSYCFGFSVGTILGFRIERRMALGFVNLRAISRTKGREVASALHDAGYGATFSHGEGRDGSVGIVNTVVPRKQAARTLKLVHEVDPGAFVVVDEARAVTRGWLPTSVAPFNTASASILAQPPPLSPEDMGAVQEQMAADGEGSD
jgi:uncharacterized protein YebE (UPF0316 family)